MRAETVKRPDVTAFVHNDIYLYYDFLWEQVNKINKKGFEAFRLKKKLREDFWVDFERQPENKQGENFLVIGMATTENGLKNPFYLQAISMDWFKKDAVLREKVLVIFLEWYQCLIQGAYIVMTDKGTIELHERVEDAAEENPVPSGNTDGGGAESGEAPSGGSGEAVRPDVEECGSEQADSGPKGGRNDD